jgi:hypothetical protein
MSWQLLADATKLNSQAAVTVLTKLIASMKAWGLSGMTASDIYGMPNKALPLGGNSQ